MSINLILHIILWKKKNLSLNQNILQFTECSKKKINNVTGGGNKADSFVINDLKSVLKLKFPQESGKQGKTQFPCLNLVFITKFVALTSGTLQHQQIFSEWQT